MKIGIVLGGGGALGAYQVGVWKALRELGLDKKVTCFAGASIGSINSLAFSALDYETIERAWLNVKGEVVLSPRDKKLKERISEDLRTQDKKNLKAYLNSFKKITKEGIYHRDPLVEVIARLVDLDKPLDHKIYATIADWNNEVYDNVFKAGIKYARDKNYFTGQYVDLQSRNKEDILTLLCASSSIPIVFPPEKFEDKLYMDGGVFDNVPYRPIVEQEDVDLIIVISLYKNRWRKIDVNHPHILMNVKGAKNKMLSFKSKNIQKSIDKGYKIAKKAFKKNKDLLKDYYKE